MDTGDTRIRVEILCDQHLVDRLHLITASTGASRNFLIRKAIRLYLDNREKPVSQQSQALIGQA
ncbi:ribbon-helix-helix protein, CopG family [Bosea sp. RAF48]|uniref:ribbon-helix-helix protein, CopG family n=1 Tax=Bosea sp. RAF48 TaxID=3237480 RepID=UPI003F9371B2